MENQPFEIGSIIKFTPKHPERFSALPGTLARVIGYMEREYVNVVWINARLTSLGMCQVNGGYYITDFTLCLDELNDIKRQDRGSLSDTIINFHLTKEVRV